MMQPMLYKLHYLNNDLDLDDDCVDLLTETFNNAVRFIDWIQGGMK